MLGHPGYLGYGGILAIHADWPAYPVSIGGEYAIKRIASFPKGTNLYFVDDIDRCILFSDSNPIQANDEFNSKLFHVAIWHSDLIELHKRGFINGIIIINEFEFRIWQHETMMIEMVEDGLEIEEIDNGFNIIQTNKKIFIKRPKPEDEDELYSWINTQCVRVVDSIAITKSGWKFLEENADLSELDSELSDLVLPLIKIEKFDTAIREAALMIESKLKTFHGNKMYGQKLINHHIGRIIEERGKTSAAIKGYRHILRSTFKFIRNDFAHNFKKINLSQTLSVLDRISLLNREIDEVIEVYFKGEVIDKRKTTNRSNDGSLRKELQDNKSA